MDNFNSHTKLDLNQEITNINLSGWIAKIDLQQEQAFQTLEVIITKSQDSLAKSKRK